MGDQKLTCPSCGAEIILYWGGAVCGDDVVFDYGYRKLDIGVQDYLASMVREVKSRAAQAGITGAEFEFGMSPAMWRAIVGLANVGDMFQVKEAISIGGVEYPIRLKEEYGDDIFFLERQSAAGAFLSGVLRRVSG